MHKGPSRDSDRNSDLGKQLMTIILLIMAIFSILITIIIEIFLYSIYNEGKILSLFSFSNLSSYFFTIGISYSLSLIGLLSYFLIKKYKEFKSIIDERNIENSYTLNKMNVTVSTQNNEANMDEDKYRYLDEKEKLVINLLINSGGKILQKDLVGYQGLTRPTVSRIIDRLDRKGLIIKVRYGSTYIIHLKK